jgi:transcriptional regulator of acetoin/glycerol metabolism
MIVRALRVAKNNKTVAAQLLGLPKTSLYNRLKRHGLAASSSSEGPVPIE